MKVGSIAVVSLPVRGRGIWELPMACGLRGVSHWQPEWPLLCHSVTPNPQQKKKSGERRRCGQHKGTVLLCPSPQPAVLRQRMQSKKQGLIAPINSNSFSPWSKWVQMGWGCGKICVYAWGPVVLWANLTTTAPQKPSPCPAPTLRM